MVKKTEQNVLGKKKKKREKDKECETPATFS